MEKTNASNPPRDEYAILSVVPYGAFPMTKQQQIRTDMVAAMKARDSRRLSVLRGLLSLFTQELTATKRTPHDALTDEEVCALIKRSVKQRREAASQFRAGKREDLAENEEAEALILEAYLPSQLSLEEIEEVVRRKMAELGPINAGGAGKLVGAALKELKGAADGGVVKSVVDRLLT